MGRAPCCDKANVKRGPWSPEEDLKLKSYIEKHGTGGNWIALPQKIGLKRCGKSCRLRWLNYLCPNIKHGGFTEDEDNLICSLYISIGSRWSIIAAQLPGRTDHDIKNYWNTRLKKKLLGSCRQRRQTKNRGHHQIHQPPPLPPPLLPTGLVSTEHAVISSSNSFTNISSITPLLDQARFSYHHPKPNNTEENIINSNLCYAYDMYSKNLLTCGSNFHCVSDLIRANNDVQSFDNEIAGDIMCRVPRELDTSFSAMGNMINNCNTTGLGDNYIGSCFAQPSAISSYEAVCQRRSMSQDWAFLDELRLLGYPE